MALKKGRTGWQTPSGDAGRTIIGPHGPTLAPGHTRRCRHPPPYPPPFRNQAGPFILLGIAILAAFVYGLVRLYQLVTAASGTLAGAAADILILAILAALCVAWLRRYRAIHGRRVKGERILALHGDWGSLKVDAERKNCALEMNGQRQVLIFADIEAARPEARQGRWYVVVALRHGKPAEWVIPVANRDAADLWAKIFRLAAVQKL
ncbi:hypothetical protein SAMN04488595_104151 [Ralstonia sp. 25mfcol4.1]|uniref:hypothetical protein n=1 Tax=Ralstonia sp. 25mfcol4.1 TaxID=1761899 RepID=UPI000885C92D|nr:hypothetical protein [Ralstonia sp. 25mfcol4.1]SDP06879.1 hypothetical protein SAMN04488595_104151 [Ralstonia sp. 25mfcol4.1]